MFAVAAPKLPASSLNQSKALLRKRQYDSALISRYSSSCSKKFIFLIFVIFFFALTGIAMLAFHVLYIPFVDCFVATVNEACVNNEVWSGH